LESLSYKKFFEENIVMDRIICLIVAILLIIFAIKLFRKKSFESFIGGSMVLAISVIFCLFFSEGGPWESKYAQPSGSGSYNFSSSKVRRCLNCNQEIVGNGFGTAFGEEYECFEKEHVAYCSRKCAKESRPSKWKN